MHYFLKYFNFFVLLKFSNKIGSLIVLKNIFNILKVGKIIYLFTTQTIYLKTKLNIALTVTWMNWAMI